MIPFSWRSRKGKALETKKNCSAIAKGWGKARDWLDYSNIHVCQNDRIVHHNGCNWHLSFEKQNKKIICLCDKTIFEKEMIKWDKIGKNHNHISNGLGPNWMVDLLCSVTIMLHHLHFCNIYISFHIYQTLYNFNRG